MTRHLRELLNRLRTGNHTEQDILTLKSRIINEHDHEVEDYLHVFSTNEKVDNHNISMLNKLPIEKVGLRAVDRIPKSLNTSKLSED